MANAQFLFNDATALAGWRASGNAGEVDGRAADLRTLQDGFLHTRVGNILQLRQPLNPPADLNFNAIGMVHFTQAGVGLNATMTQGAVRNFAVSDVANQIIKAHEVGGVAPRITQIDLPMHADDRLALLLFGNIVEQEVFYPTGWKPPILRGSEDVVTLSNTGYPINRARRRLPLKFNIPLRFVSEDDAKGKVQQLIYKLQQSPCLFKADATHAAVYCWLVGRSQEFSYVAPRLLEVRLDMQGFVDYA